MKTLLKAVTIIDSSSPYHLKKQDILIENGVIKQIAPEILSTEEYKVICLSRMG